MLNIILFLFYLFNFRIHSNLETGPSPSNTLQPNTNFSDTTGNTSCNINVESQTADTANNSDLEKSFESRKETPVKRKKIDHAGEMVNIMRENAAIRKEKYEKKQSSRHDDVELFYLCMAKIAKRLTKA